MITHNWMKCNDQSCGNEFVAKHGTSTCNVCGSYARVTRPVSNTGPTGVGPSTLGLASASQTGAESARLRRRMKKAVRQYEHQKRQEEKRQARSLGDSLRTVSKEESERIRKKFKGGPAF